MSSLTLEDLFTLFFFTLIFNELPRSFVINLFAWSYYLDVENFFIKYF